MRRSGFTLIELLLAITLIVIIAGVYVMTANPAGQLASARNTERELHLQTIMNAVRQNIADQGNEQFSCAAGPIPATATIMASASGSYDIAPCLIPSYIGYAMPFDPNAPGAYFSSSTDYNTGYTILANASGSITVAAPSAELGKIISVTR
jgi:prepilin-type N-terminal cleavage/methylation domain-containing protein